MQNIIPPDDPQHNPSHTKRCSKCHLWLPFDRFGPFGTSKDGLYSWCNKCRSRHYQKTKDPVKERDRNYRLNYGITAKQYDRMFAEQNGVCKACGNPETQKAAGRSAKEHPDRINPLAVDHDHETGDVRSLLCFACNSSLGTMKEDPERIQKLKEYAEWCKRREPDVKFVQLKLVD